MLDIDATRGIVFVRLFDVRGDELRTFVGFLPLTLDAYKASQAEVVKRLDIPTDWPLLREEWRAAWSKGEAGVFSRPLDEVTRDTLDAVDHFRDIPPGESAVIELAYPKRSQSGNFDTIAAVVRTAAHDQWK